MELGILALLALVLGASVTGALVSTWSLHRRSLRLEYRVSDLEERLLTVKNREKAEKRWDKSRTLEEEAGELLRTAAKPGRSERYANDPLPHEF